MLNFKTMSIRSKLIFAFAATVILMSCAIITALGSMRAVSDANAVVRDHLQPALDAIGDLRLAVRRADDSSAYIGMAKSAKSVEDAARQFESDVDEAHAAFKRSVSLADTDEQRSALSDYEKFFDGDNQYLAQTRHGIALKREGKSSQAQDVFLAASVESSIGYIRRYQQEAKRLMGDGQRHAEQLQAFAFIASTALGGFGLLMSVFAVFITLRSTANTVHDVNRSVQSVAAAAGQISAGNTDLSQRTEEQAASLEETAASMEEFTATVKQNADNARQANSLAIGASRVAEDGGAVVTEMVNTMSSIGESAKRIEDIISVIDGIAFQTNILALNAAVEAARAGEQGRGFAVVAGEVRNLAQRSASAAKEIKTLISDSVEKTGVGIKLADRAGTTMSEIVTAVRRVTDIMNEISAASSEQSSGVEQVAQAITQMDQVTQQNAALVEEIAAAAASLEQMAQTLATSMTVFGFDETGIAPARLAPTISVRQPVMVAANAKAPRPRLAREPVRVPTAAGPTAENDRWSSF